MEQGQGRDTRVMLPVFGCVFMAAVNMFLPWFSIPVLKYDGYPRSYNLWHIKECLTNINISLAGGIRWAMEPLSQAEIDSVLSVVSWFQRCAVGLSVLLCAGAVMAFWKREKSVVFLKILCVLSVLFSCAGVWAFYRGNYILNEKMGREQILLNYTTDSYLQLTAYPYAQLVLSVLLFFTAKSLLDTGREYAAQVYIERAVKEDTKFGKRTCLSAVIILIGIPAVILFGAWFLNERSNHFIALCIIGMTMLPFLMVFEDRRPQARELLLIAVMAALAVVGRVAFFMIPQFKPVVAIVIITGVNLGAEAGFLTGVVAGFVSNFFFGQGPWTPWQMFAFGIIGFLAGLLFRGKRKKWGENKWVLCIYGGIATFVIYGLVMDCYSIVNFLSGINKKALLASIASGVVFNAAHGVSTIIFLFFLAKPMGKKLSRIKKKYGIMER